MTQDICRFVPPSCDLLALGEPTHGEPAFPAVRNRLFARLAAAGFRSIALETDRVAALVVDDYVRDGTGTLDTAMREGFSHGFGELEGNRRLVAWMREYNQARPPAQRLSFHGFDAATELMSAPSPRPHLEHARDYLGLDLDIAGPAGDDERWSRTEAVLDPAESPGATAGAVRLRAIADDLLTEMYARAPELIAATSRTAWHRARIRLTAGLGLLRYHHRSAQRVDGNTRLSGMSGVRDALMAQNLLEIRDLEARRGPTLVFANNLHLQRNRSVWRMGEHEWIWWGAGAVVSALIGDRYVFVAGSLGRSDALGLAEPGPDTTEGHLQRGIATWGLRPASAVLAGAARTDGTPEQGYFPLDGPTLAGADAVLHISLAAPADPTG